MSLEKWITAPIHLPSTTCTRPRFRKLARPIPHKPYRPAQTPHRPLPTAALSPIPTAPPSYLRESLLQLRSYRPTAAESTTPIHPVPHTPPFSARKTRPRPGHQPRRPPPSETRAHNGSSSASSATGPKAAATSKPWSLELGANRIAAPYWRTHDPAPLAHRHAVFQGVVDPTPAPPAPTAFRTPKPASRRATKSSAPSRRIAAWRAQISSEPPSS